MALTNMNMGDHLKPMSELSNYKIEKGDPDPRGWPVVASDGHRLGVVDDLIVDTSAMKVRHLVVDPSGSGTTGAHQSGTNRDSIVLSVDDVDMSNDRHQVLARRVSGQEFDTSSGAYAYSRSAASGATEESRRLTRSEEELHIGKREVERGEARVGKHVETERVSEPVTRRREEVVVERRPVEAGARADANTFGDDEVRIPLMEEEVVVEKRPVVKEELVVGKRVVEERDTVEAEVRREEFDIDTRGTERTRGSESTGAGSVTDRNRRDR